MFKPSGREDSKNLVQADACESIGFKLNRGETSSDRVCKPCGRKIRNAVELYNFLKEAVAETTEKEQISENNERRKRQLSTTITPDRNEIKKSQSRERAKSRTRKSRKSLFLETTEQ